MFDLISAVELTASAAVVVAAVSIGLGRDVATRLRLAAALAAWFVVVVVLGATEVLTYEHGIGVQSLGLAVVVPIVVLMASLFRVPALRDGLERVPLALLTAVNVVRVLGVSFVLLHAAGRLPAPFAPAAGWGDIAVGVLAIPVAGMVARQAPGWRRALLAWNAFGLADLVVAVTLGVMSSPGPLRMFTDGPGSGIMSTLPWLIIPGFLVPVLVTTHLVIFYRLLRGTRTAGEGRHRSGSSVARESQGVI